MIDIQPIDTTSKKEVERFVQFPYRLYKDEPHWVPPLLMDARMFLNKAKHPYYEHSDADFFVAVQDGELVGRIAALENKPYNQYHDKHQAQFYLFETIDDAAVVEAIFGRVSEWARARGLNQIVGPKGFGPLDGYGLQIEGYEHRQMMTMMNYNYPYYPMLVEGLGFRKEVDFVSCYLGAEAFRLPERVHRIAERVLARGSLGVKRFKSKRELLRWGPRIGRAYNQSFVHNWEYYPLTQREIDFVVDNIMVIADPRLIKIITHDDDVVGFLFAFPDVSAALQKARGRLFPTGIIHLLREVKRTNWVALNGAGILPEFQGRGGNALLYAEMENTIHEFHFEHADLTQVAESAVQMRADLVNLGGKPYKNHRVYIKDI
jgi:hypothetical protein